MPKNYCIMQIWAESGKSALPICNYSQILYQFLTFTQNLKRSRGIIRSGGNTKIIMIIDIIGTWFIGIPLCLLAAYVFKWGIVGVYTLLTTEELFRLAVSLIIFRRRKWIISLC